MLSQWSSVILAMASWSQFWSHLRLRLEEPAPQRTPPGETGRARRVAQLAGAAAIGAALAAGAFALWSPGPAPQRRVPARLEQVITDRSALLNGGIAFSPDGMLLAVTSSFDTTAIVNLATGARAVFVQHASGGAV